MNNDCDRKSLRASLKIVFFLDKPANYALEISDLNGQILDFPIHALRQSENVL